MRVGFVFDRRHLHPRHPRIRVQRQPELFGRGFPQIDHVPLERDLVLRFRIDIVGFLARRHEPNLENLLFLKRATPH